MVARRKPAPTSAATAVVYLRVSTVHQAASGLGADAQERACREYAERQHLRIVGTFKDDGVSGKVANRPGLQSAIAAVREHGAVLLVYSVSRLARTQKQLWNLIDDRDGYGLPVVSATEPFDVSTPMGRAFLGMLATFAQLESDLASERTSDALASARAQGTKLGAPSMVESTDAEGRRFVDPVKVALVKRVQQLHASGGFSLRELAQKLNADGVPGARGGQWHPKTLRTALQLEV